VAAHSSLLPEGHLHVPPSHQLPIFSPKGSRLRMAGMQFSVLRHPDFRHARFVFACRVNDPLSSLLLFFSELLVPFSLDLTLRVPTGHVCQGMSVLFPHPFSQ